MTDLPATVTLRLMMSELIEVLDAVNTLVVSMARIGGEVDDEAERADVIGRYIEGADLTRRLSQARYLLWTALEGDVPYGTVLALEEVLEQSPKWPDIGPPYIPVHERHADQGE